MDGAERRQPRSHRGGRSRARACRSCTATRSASASGRCHGRHPRRRPAKLALYRRHAGGPGLRPGRWRNGSATDRRSASASSRSIMAAEPALARDQRGRRPEAVARGPARRGSLMDVVRIGDRPVGAGAPVYIIAEAGSNHDRDLDQARRLIDVAAEAGADAVKFQTFRSDAIVAETPTRAEYLDAILPPGQTMSELFAPARAAARVARDASREHATDRGLDFLSTPFDHEAVDLLDELGVKAFKVATYELWHLPLIRDIASRGKPIICSTGMADMARRPGAGRRRARDRQRAADPAALRRQLPAAVRRPEPAGDRDDAPGVRGAGRLERPHAGLAGAGRRDDPRRGGDREALHDRPRAGRGPTTGSPSSPTSWPRWCARSATPRRPSATGVKRRAPAEDDLYVTARRSLFAARPIEAGAVVGADDIAVLRPGTGLEVARPRQGHRADRPPPHRAPRAARLGHVLMTIERTVTDRELARRHARGVWAGEFGAGYADAEPGRRRAASAASGTDSSSGMPIRRCSRWAAGRAPPRADRPPPRPGRRMGRSTSARARWIGRVRSRQGQPRPELAPGSCRSATGSSISRTRSAS